jgi:energy-coupling factor transporter transmembrane protein EcfT
MTLAIKATALIILGLSIILLEGFWLQSIIEHFTYQSLSVVACLAMVVVVNALLPKSLESLLLLSLFVTQCYIWII